MPLPHHPAPVLAGSCCCSLQSSVQRVLFHQVAFWHRQVTGACTLEVSGFAWFQVGLEAPHSSRLCVKSVQIRLSVCFPAKLTILSLRVGVSNWIMTVPPPKVDAEFNRLAPCLSRLVLRPTSLARHQSPQPWQLICRDARRRGLVPGPAQLHIAEACAEIFLSPQVTFSFP